MLSPDPFPDEGLFVRSDQYSFVRAGVPSLFLNLGMKSANDGVDAAAEVKKWLVTNYHSPKDDGSQSIQYGDAEKLAQFTALVTYHAANDPSRPAWNQNDFFGKRFAK